jgi:ABC-2 type transport system permease protein
MKLLFSILKEALLLARDRGGLALLFIMPTALVLIVTLVQEDAYKAVKASSTALLYVDGDGGTFGADMGKGLSASGYFQVVRELQGKALTPEEGRRAVARGDYQACVVLPAGASGRIKEVVSRRLEQALAGQPSAPTGAVVELTLYFDPAIRESYRKAVTASLERISLAIETRIIFATLKGLMGGGTDLPVGDNPLIALREVTAGHKEAEAVPSSVQQNVPAWTLFAMFMIVIPLSGCIIKEREGGTLTRLSTLPVSHGTILAGKVVVYLGVCLAQFAVMLLIGTLVMPRFGLPRLVIGPHYLALFAAALSSALAATGFGIMTGTLARTHDQAAVFGSTFVVIAGALGGIMVPTFLMPAGMRAISAWSPLNWGHAAFLDIFLRGADLRAILPHLASLLLFSVGTMLAAVLSFLRRD